MLAPAGTLIAANFLPKSFIPATSFRNLSDSTKKWGSYREGKNPKISELGCQNQQRREMVRPHLKININVLFFFLPGRSLWGSVYSFTLAAAASGCACVELLGVSEVGKVQGMNVALCLGSTPLPTRHTLTTSIILMLGTKCNTCAEIYLNSINNTPKKEVKRWHWKWTMRPSHSSRADRRSHNHLQLQTPFPSTTVASNWTYLAQMEMVFLSSIDDSKHRHASCYADDVVFYSIVPSQLHGFSWLGDLCIIGMKFNLWHSR